MKNPVTIIMPVYNGHSTLRQVFELLVKVELSDIEEMIIINDGSKDDSASLLLELTASLPFKVQIITNKLSAGLANGYNRGIKAAKTEYIILMHQDIGLTDHYSFAKIIEPLKYEDTYGTYPSLLHPLELWSTYGIWQKALFSRFVGRKLNNFTGKFDAIKKSKIIELGLFDSATYRTAGEDGDLKARIRDANKNLTLANVSVVHMQEAEPKFPLKKFVRKEAQLAEGHGAILRKHGVKNIKGEILANFRQLLVLAFIVSLINKWLLIATSALIVIYSFTYTKRVYQTEYTNPKIALLPFINIFLLLVATYYSGKGFISGKQRL